MEFLLGIGVWFLGLVPLILVFYVTALLGVATWSERGPGYRVKAALIFVLGFGAILAVHILLRSGSTLQVAETVGLSLVQISFALALAALTVDRLAD